jgi:non-heme chloroperoxidase
MTAPRVPVVFVHGLWLHSTSWQPWAERFREAGFDPILPEWPGVPDTVAEARAHPESQAGVGIDEVIDHHARIVADSGWPEIADAALGWLAKQGMGNPTPPA